MPTNLNDIEKRLWEAADQLRANSRLKSSEYSVPVLGLIFLRYADFKFSYVEEELKKTQGAASGRRGVSKADYQARGVLYLPPNARFSYLLNLPEGADLSRAIKEAMTAIEADNEDLKDVLPRITTSSKIAFWLLCSRPSPASQWTSKATSSVKFTSISWASLPWPKARRAVSSLRPHHWLS